MAPALAYLCLLFCLFLPPGAAAAEATRPAWSDLTASQRKILAPLQDEWPNISALQRKRWIALAERYPRMSEAEQKRIQNRMQDWAKLTPQQREAARARYRALSKLSPEQRRAIIKQWTESQEAQQTLEAAQPPESGDPAKAPEPGAESGRTSDTAASVSVRLLSLLYEAVLLAALLLLATAVFLGVAGESTGQPRRLLLQIYLIVVAGLYFVFSWTGGRRTLPMRTWRLRLLDARGASPSPGRAVVRYLAALVSVPLGGVGLAWALVDRERRFLHDRIAGTRVVRDPAAKARGARR
jgi:uncharacterized RDD family membrane protein YckC